MAFNRRTLDFLTDLVSVPEVGDNERLILASRILRGLGVEAINLSRVDMTDVAIREVVQQREDTLISHMSSPTNGDEIIARAIGPEIMLQNNGTSLAGYLYFYFTLNGVPTGAYESTPERSQTRPVLAERPNLARYLWNEEVPPAPPPMPASPEAVAGARQFTHHDEDDDGAIF